MVRSYFLYKLNVISIINTLLNGWLLLKEILKKNIWVN